MGLLSHFMAELVLREAEWLARPLGNVGEVQVGSSIRWVYCLPPVPTAWTLDTQSVLGPHGASLCLCRPSEHRWLHGPVSRVQSHISLPGSPAADPGFPLHLLLSLHPEAGGD